MHQFNNQLEVGQLAMIINTHQVENLAMIGKIVTVECFTKEGDDLSQYWSIYEGKVTESRSGMAICSGVTPPKPAVDSLGRAMITGYVRLKREYLMPLPPLEEKQSHKQSELTQ